MPCARPCQHYRLKQRSPVIKELEEPEEKRMNRRESSAEGLPQVIRLGDSALFWSTEGRGLRVQVQAPPFAYSVVLQKVLNSSPLKLDDNPSHTSRRGCKRSYNPEGLPSTMQAPEADLPMAHTARPGFSTGTQKWPSPLHCPLPATLLIADILQNTITSVSKLDYQLLRYFLYLCNSLPIPLSLTTHSTGLRHSIIICPNDQWI